MSEQEIKLPISKKGDYTDWDVDHEDPLDGMVSWAPIFEADGEVMAFAVATGHNSHDAARRNLIVTAVNSHKALKEALDRQCDNMAFILNHMAVPDPWYEKFTNELAEDRKALANNPKGEE